MADPKPVAHRKPDPERRSEQLHLRISPRDKAVFTAAARKSFTEDVSQWARQVMLKAADAVGITYETVTVPEVGADPVPVVVVKKGKGPKAAPSASKAKRAARPKG